MEKKKILLLSDHALSTSGVGTQSRHLMNGLIEKGCWSVRQLGAALKHADYNVVQINPDFIIKPIDGFGNKDMLRVILATEKPDIIFLFTDPRFFLWLFEMEDEIHQMCPIVWWHVWDNYPYPDFNDPLYEATDLINCHSHLTYTMVSERHPEKTNFIPHALPRDVYFQMGPTEIANRKLSALGPNRADDFIFFWMNRNARRKRPGDLLKAFQGFLNKLEKEHGHRKATLIMHTDPLDQEGPNLLAVVENLDIKDNVIFSTARLDFADINVLHNISDCCINVSYAEGFGLATLEAMQTGTPIIAPKTGGQTRQVVDHRDGSENGVALNIDFQSLVGSQNVPYIYEDYASIGSISDAMWKMYSLTPDEKVKMSKKVKDYAFSEFGFQKTVDLWHETLLETLENWEKRYNRYSVTTL